MQNEPHSTFIMGDRLFDLVKKLVQVVLPACGALYFGLAQIWGLPEAENVVGTIVVFQTFLGVVLGISTAQYNASGKGIDGSLTIQDNTVTSLKLDAAGKDLFDKKSVTVKVEHEEAPILLEDLDEDEDLEPEIPPHRKPRAKPKKK